MNNTITLTCPCCGKPFDVDEGYYRFLSDQGAAPVLFCSKACEAKGWNPPSYRFRKIPVSGNQ